MTDVVARQNVSLVSLQAKYDTILAERDAAQAEIEKLRLLIRQLQRGQFGRRSEKLDPDQLQLGLEDLEQTAAAAEAAQEEIAARSSTPRPPRVRRRNLGALPAHLPRVEVLVDVEDKACPCCGGAMHVIGEDTSEMLDIVPAQYRVRGACWWLEPLWHLLRRHVLSAARLFADDTPLPVLDPGRGRTKTGRLWRYAVDDRPCGGETPPAVAHLYGVGR